MSHDIKINVYMYSFEEKVKKGVKTKAYFLLYLSLWWSIMRPRYLAPSRCVMVHSPWESSKPRTKSHCNEFNGYAEEIRLTVIVRRHEKMKQVFRYGHHLMAIIAVQWVLVRLGRKEYAISLICHWSRVALRHLREGLRAIRARRRSAVSNIRKVMNIHLRNYVEGIVSRL